MNRYELYVDGDKFYDVRIDELALMDPVLELTENNAGTLTFTIPKTHPKFESFNPLTSTIEIYRDGEWFWEGRIVSHESDFYNAVEYTVEGALGYLNDSVQPQAEFHDVTPIGYVEQLLNVHNSMVPENRKINLGAVTVRDPNNSMYRYTNFNSTLAELKEDVIDDLGGHLRLRKVNGELFLDVLDDYARICSQVIQLGSNLIDLAPSFDFKDIASVIIPLGATLEDQEEHEEGLEALDKYVTIEEVNDGKNYIAREDLLNSYERIWRVVHFQNIHTPQGLLEKAQDYLTDGQWGEMVIQAKAFDLNYTDEEFQEFRLGDRVRVKSDLHGIDRYFPLTAQTIYFNNVSENTVTLGGTGEPVSITDVTNQVTITSEKLDERIKDPNRLIQQAIYEATQLITQGLNGYVRVNGNEILIMDTDDPATAKHVWRWNMGGLGYSDNGYNGPFETAITMDGTIVGKFLAANSVVAEQIDVNYRSHVEQQITQAESDANDYTDGKLKNYWTYKEVETQLKTTADSITASVNTTLKSYSTTEQIRAMLSVTEGNITTYVGDTLRSYSTTTQVESMINQKAGEITTTVSEVQSDVNGLQTSLKSVEQKVTTDGIFTTINNGIAGSERIYNTKFEMTRSGLTIQGGGITIKNNAGTQVFYADTRGNLTMQGDFMHYGNTTYQAIGIEDHEVKVYAYNQSGNYLGSLGALTEQGSSTPRIGLWSDYGDDLVLGTKPSSYGTQVNSIIQLGSSGGSIGIKYIRDTYSGSIYYGDSTLSVNNGLISNFNGTPVSSGTIYIGDGHITFANGICTNARESSSATGSITILGTTVNFTRGIITSTSGSTPRGVTTNTLRFGGCTLNFTDGIFTGNTAGTGWGVTGRLGWGPGYLQFTDGFLTSYNQSGPSGYQDVLIPGGGTARLSLSYGIISQIDYV